MSDFWGSPKIHLSKNQFYEISKKEKDNY